MINPEKIKKDFPFFSANKKLAYLDNAATTQKPRAVLQALTDHYTKRNANIHRGIYRASEEATLSYEAARQKIARFIGALDARSVIFTRNATEAINLVAYSFARKNLKRKDEILLTVMEHHANIVPWRMLAEEKGLVLKFVSITKDGVLDEKDFKKKLTQRTKLFAVTHASNVLGTINPVKKLTRLCHAKGIPVLIDGAQAAPHLAVDVADIGCDFYAFSGHKMLAPTGIGVLYMSKRFRDTLPPFLGGGEMIRSVSTTSVTFQDAPAKFEAGTPAIEAAVALGAAVDYLSNIGMRALELHEQSLSAYALRELRKIPGITMYGPHDAKKRTGLISFNLTDIHPHDIASLLDEQNIAMRAGHHCAMPLHHALNVSATLRMSFAVYTTKQDIKKACATLKEISKKLNS